MMSLIDQRARPLSDAFRINLYLAIPVFIAARATAAATAGGTLKSIFPGIIYSGQSSLSETGSAYKHLVFINNQI